MRAILAVFAIAVVALPAHAQTGPGFFEITPYGAYSFGGTFTDTESSTEVKLQDSSTFGLLLNFRQTADTQWEILYSLQNTEAEVLGESMADVNVHYLQGGGTYQFDSGRVRPFMSATIGGTHIDAESDGFGSDTFFGFSIGGGIQVAPSNRIGLRLEARAFGTLVRSGSSIFCVSDPAGGTAGCAISVAGDVLWQLQTMAGIVFRF